MRKHIIRKLTLLIGLIAMIGCAEINTLMLQW